MNEIIDILFGVGVFAVLMLTCTCVLEVFNKYDIRVTHNGKEVFTYKSDEQCK